MSKLNINKTQTVEIGWQSINVNHKQGTEIKAYIIDGKFEGFHWADNTVGDSISLDTLKELEFVSEKINEIVKEAKKLLK